MKATVKATGGDDWEMLASTNDGRVIRSMNSKAHKWNVQVIAGVKESCTCFLALASAFIEGWVR
jgi:hypothetical protein